MKKVNEDQELSGVSTESLSPTQIKVFRINEYEWWAAETLQDAIKACCEEYDLTEDEAIEEPYELTEEQMKEHLMYEFSYDWQEERDEPPSFRECLDIMVKRGDEFPRPFASTEW